MNIRNYTCSLIGLMVAVAAPAQELNLSYGISGVYVGPFNKIQSSTSLGIYSIEVGYNNKFDFSNKNWGYGYRILLSPSVSRDGLQYDAFAVSCELSYSFNSPRYFLYIGLAGKRESYNRDPYRVLLPPDYSSSVEILPRLNGGITRPAVSMGIQYDGILWPISQRANWKAITRIEIGKTISTSNGNSIQGEFEQAFNVDPTFKIQFGLKYLLH